VEGTSSSIVVTGANGAVGRAIVRLAPSRGVDVIAAVRSARAAAEVRERASAAQVVRVSYGEPQSLVPALEGASALIHLPGVLFERPGSSYEVANVETTRCVVWAASRAGVSKIVFVSAIGADPHSPNRYWRSKGEAEQLVRESGVPFTILRVPMLLGRATEAAAALRRRLRHRCTLMLDGGRTLQQPLDVDDVAHAALAACAGALAADRTLELVGPVTVTAGEIVERAARLTGRRVRILPVPARPAERVLRAVRRLTGHGVPDALEVLATDTRVDAAPAATALGIELTPLEAMIRKSLAS
jgi:NADH dehydrogenase